MLLEKLKTYIAEKTNRLPILKKVIKAIYNFLFKIILFIPCRISTKNSYIPIIISPEDFNRVIQKGKFENKRCYYKTALLNTLIKLKPKVCLEIGTHYGGTAGVFEYYFEKYKRDGVLITADIKKYADIENKFVKQVIVYPHIKNIEKFHQVNKEELLVLSPNESADSVKENIKILKKELEKVDEKLFDFAFVDGDHQRKSFLADISIALQLTKYPHYILLDDTKDEIHESAFVYHNEIIKKFNHYDFEDWPIFVGMSLIWENSDVKNINTRYKNL